MSFNRSLILPVLALVVVGMALAALPPVSQAQETRPQVIASFSILADIAAQVAGDAADVESLIPLGANPHAYEPSARDVAALSDADAVLVVGMNFEEGLLDVLEEAAGERVVEVSDCVPVRPVIAGAVHVHEHEHTDDAHDDEHDHDADAHDDEHDHDADAHDDEHDHDADAHDDEHAHAEHCEAHHDQVHAAFGIEAEHAHEGEVLGLVAEGACAAGNCDPHVWTDPVNAALWTLTVRDTLSELDPAHADVYAANAAAYLDELAALDADIRALIDVIPAERRYIVTNHLAFNYFAVRYGLELVGVVIPGGSTTTEPTVQEVLNLIEAIQTYNVPAIFTETTVSEDLAQQIADEAGAQIVPLYTGSLSEADGSAATYLDYMRFNAGQMAGALR